MKKLSRQQMKNVMGGYFPVANADCRASASCANGSSVSCEGYTGTWSGDGSTMGCNGQDNYGVSCYQFVSGTWKNTSINCSNN